MAIPNGSGSEILQRGWFAGLTNTNVYAMFDGTIATTTSSNAVPTNIIITVISIVILLGDVNLIDSEKNFNILENKDKQLYINYLFDILYEKIIVY